MCWATKKPTSSLKSGTASIVTPASTSRAFSSYAEGTASISQSVKDTTIALPKQTELISTAIESPTATVVHAAGPFPGVETAIRECPLPAYLKDHWNLENPICTLLNLHDSMSLAMTEAVTAASY